VELGTVTLKGGKAVTAWAAELAIDAQAIESNTFTLEWPPRSGKEREFPEVDRAEWLKEILDHEELFMKLYRRLPREILSVRDLLLSGLCRSPERWENGTTWV